MLLVAQTYHLISWNVLRSWKKKLNSTWSTFKHNNDSRHDTEIHKKLLSKKNIEFSHRCKWTTKYKYSFLWISLVQWCSCDFMSQILTSYIYTRNLFSCHNNIFLMGHLVLILCILYTSLLFNYSIVKITTYH
jgi:hypothetical protein